MLLCALVACKKRSGGSDKPSVKPTVPYDSLINMVANINATRWTTDSVKGYRIIYAHDSARYGIQITGTQYAGDSTSTMTLYITDYKGKDTYNVSPPENTATLYQNGKRYFADTGKIIITADSPSYIGGAFFFIIDSLNVTDGE
ncbi:MAG: hypothetical protein EBX41_10130, partial [Chitinophagia bacterium]|nr:hypothetical protein [Chitinophagia bacterium]